MAIKSNSSDDAFLQSGEVRLVSAPFWTRPGFAIPLVQSGQSGNATYIQRVGSSGRIKFFDRFDGDANIFVAQSVELAEIGGQEIFGLVDPDGAAHVGTQDALGRLVRTWVSDIPDLITKISFCMFCGHQKLAENSAKALMKRKTDEFDDKIQAVRWFVTGIMLPELLSLARREPEEKNATWSADLSEAYMALSVDDNIGIRLDLPPEIFKMALGSGRAKAKFNKITRMTSVATGYAIYLSDISSEGSRFPPRVNIDYQGAISRIHGLKRQEDRIASLIKIATEQGPDALDFLKIYRDRATFAQGIVDHIIIVLDNCDSGDELSALLSRDMARIVRSAYPFRRGKFLLALSEALSHNQNLNESIRRVVMKSGARDVEALRDSIMGNLSVDRST